MNEGVENQTRVKVSELREYSVQPFNRVRKNQKTLLRIEHLKARLFERFRRFLSRRVQRVRVSIEKKGRKMRRGLSERAKTGKCSSEAVGNSLVIKGAKSKTLILLYLQTRENTINIRRPT
jgi:hypothetical protein